MRFTSESLTTRASERSWQWHRTGIATLIAICSAYSSLNPATNTAFAAAEPELDTYIPLVQQYFLTLDHQADLCLENNQPERTESDACQTFLAMIDGQETASYLDMCRALRNWRTSFIEELANSDFSIDSNPANLDQSLSLNRLAQTEYYCGEDALRSRTNHVHSAFNLLRQNEVRISTGSTTAIHGLPANGGLRAIHDRLQREIDQQWQNLQMENLRQQSRQPMEF